MSEGMGSSASDASLSFKHSLEVAGPRAGPGGPGLLCLPFPGLPRGLCIPAAAHSLPTHPQAAQGATPPVGPLTEGPFPSRAQEKPR